MSVEELIGWSSKKFDKFNLAFARRKTVEAMEARKLSMITGMYANTNYDDNKGTRARAINELENQFKEAIAEVYDPTPKIDLKGNAFFDAMKVPGENLTDEEIAKALHGENAQTIAYAHGAPKPSLPTNLYEDIDQVPES